MFHEDLSPKGPLSSIAGKSSNSSNFFWTMGRRLAPLSAGSLHHPWDMGCETLLLEGATALDADSASRYPFNLPTSSPD
jgi:hypothetical protein